MVYILIFQEDEINACSLSKNYQMSHICDPVILHAYLRYLGGAEVQHPHMQATCLTPPFAVGKRKPGSFPTETAFHLGLAVLASLFFILFLCVNVPVFSCVPKHTCAHVCGSQGLTSGVISHEFSTWIF